MKIPKGVSAYHCGSSRSESSLKDLASVICDSCSAPLHRVGIHDANAMQCWGGNSDLLGHAVRLAVEAGCPGRR